ncbi:MAG: dTDP-4-dehydrorhamnose reductase [Bacteroidales bacterium]|nr:dTDP-4-dehydrorhamnose reductase [Bacteroidales bacterium]
MTKILITGANGQLGSELSTLCQTATDIELIATDVDTLDICNATAVDDFIQQHRPDVLVNCAAYTAVDNAEKDADMAQRLNVDAVENLAKACCRHHVKMIHISTDYVFSGTAHTPYEESDKVCPQSVYGTTKAAGERILCNTLPDAVVIRTAWLYSSYGKNFVKTMRNLGMSRTEINVVADQFGTPTYAADLAQAVMTIINSATWQPGIYHFTNEGYATWYDFACAIMLESGINCKVNPIATSEYPTPAQRPAYSVLCKKKIRNTYGIEPPHWLDALKRCIATLQQQQQ